MSADDTPVEIPDEALRTLLADRLGKDADDEITRDDMASLTSLSYSWPVVGERVDIADLTGLEFAANLSNLYLRGNDIVDLVPLADLDKLASLDLEGNQIVDLSPLADMPVLEMLFIGRNPIEDVSPLASLPRLAHLDLWSTHVVRPALGKVPLQTLNLRGSRVSDLTGLKDLADLRELDLGDNPLTDLSPLGHLPRLRELQLDRCDLVDLSGLSGLRAVTRLMLGHNAITDLSPLSGLSTLVSLQIPFNDVVDISPLGTLTGLSNLGADHNAIEHLTAIAGMEGLTGVSLTGNRVADLSPLAGLKVLRSLDIVDNRVEDLSPLAGLVDLRALDISNNRVEDLSPIAELRSLRDLRAANNAIRFTLPLAGLPDLETLDLSFNRIARLTSLSGSRALRTLNIARNEVTDLSGLEALDQLGSLTITGNRVHDLMPLAGLDHLSALYASYNAITDLSPLAGLSRLSMVYLSGNDIVDLSPLAEVPNLGSLYANGNRIRDLSPLAGLRRLFYLNVSDNEVVDLSPLRERSPWQLYLDRNRVEDIEPLTGVDGLRVLSIDDNRLADLSPVADMPWLSHISADGNAITDLSGVSINGNLGEHGERIEGFASLARNPLDEAALDVHVPALEAEGNWVTMRVDHARLLAPTSARLGFVRVVNDAHDANRVRVSGFDDNGRWGGMLVLAVPGDGAEQFTSTDYYNGNPSKGMPRTLFYYSAAGDLGLELQSSSKAVKVLSYVRGANGHLAALGGLVPPEDSTDGHEFRVRTFVPAGNGAGIGLLHITNANRLPADVEVARQDDSGETLETTVRLRLDGFETRTLTAADLEAGDGAHGVSGDGEEMWRVRVTSNRLLRVRNLLESADFGRLTNLHSAPVRSVPHNGGTRYLVPLFAADGAMLRILNRSGEDGTADVRALDDAGSRHGVATLSIGAGEAVNLNRADLRDGMDCLAGVVDAGDGHWRLVVESGLDLEVLAFAVAEDGFLENMSLATTGRRHDLAYFNPGSNRTRQSILRLVNWGLFDAQVEIEGVDDTGSSRRVSTVVRSDTVRMLSAAELEHGGQGLVGALGDGTGKWRLRIDADHSLDAMSLMATPVGFGNLTDDPDAWEAPASR